MVGRHAVLRHRALLWGVSLWVGCTACTAATRQDDGHDAPVFTAPPSLAPSSTTTSTTTLAPAAIPSAAASDGALAGAAPPPHEGPLAHFHDALRALERGQRQRHVRVMWLGDSHAQADFWPDAIRGGLQNRFGNGGPGFVHLGFRAYRHADIKTELGGQWRFRPKKPSTVDKWDDGAFGLGGILHAGYADKRWATVTLSDESLAEREVLWDLCYKFGLPEDDLMVSLGADASALTAKGIDELSTLRHVTLKSRGPATLKVDIKAGRTDFCGLVIETSEPGVVLDNLGINGARYATALAWNEDAWGTEVKRRPPDLWIYEYGGNEASDGILQPERYQREARELIARGKRIAPEASCLVIGPADRADAESKIPPIVEAMRAAASASGCAFWDTYTTMGGKGSLARWRDEDKAAEDGIHLKPKGYAEVGALLLADLMKDYRR